MPNCKGRRSYTKNRVKPQPILLKNAHKQLNIKIINMYSYGECFSGCVDNQRFIYFQDQLPEYVSSLIWFKLFAVGLPNLI
jgi:hypothetical protein